MLRLATLALFGVAALAAPAPAKRDEVQTSSVQATGTGLDPLPVFYIDGLAYIGSEIPSWATTATNITFTNPTDASSSFVIQSNTTTAADTSAVDGAQLYIVPGEKSQVGFVGADEDTPAGATTEGFLWFGDAITWISEEEEYLQNFWAVPSNTTGLYSLIWSPVALDDDDIISVTLETTPSTTD